MQKSNRAHFIITGILVVLGIGWTGAGPRGAGAGGAAPEAGKAEINWMNVEAAAGKLKQEQRPVLIDLYTTWCGWCKQMDRKTYTNKHVIEYIESKFYPVKLDAETRDVVNWKGRAFGFNAGAKVNDFAMYLTRGQLEFPTTIIIPPGGDPQAIPGYMEPKDIEELLKYFGEGKYQTESFDVWHSHFKRSW